MLEIIHPSFIYYAKAAHKINAKVSRSCNSL